MLTARDKLMQLPGYKNIADIEIKQSYNEFKIHNTDYNFQN